MGREKIKYNKGARKMKNIKQGGFLGKYRGIAILLMLFLLATLTIPFDFFPFNSFNKQTPEEKQEICYNDCILNGWEYGLWIGYQFCNCYNLKIKVNQQDEDKEQEK